RIGHGGINQIQQQTGAAWQTIKNGILEIEAHNIYQPGKRIRKEGGGRKKLSDHQPDLVPLVEKTADPKGDPMNTIRWTTHSMEHIANAIQALGYLISPMSIYRILKAKGFALKANKKEIEGKGTHADRDAQFNYINKIGLTMQLAGALIL